jgi:hypothetical protein
MFNVPSGNILRGMLYLVAGGQSVTYNGATYNSWQTFRGVQSVLTYTFSGTGTQLVYEVAEIAGGELELAQNGLDTPIFPDTTVLTGFAIEFQQNANDIILNDITALNGFAVELLDYPYYSFEITETRL